MLRDRGHSKLKDAFSLKIKKKWNFVKVNVSKHFECEASCQLHVLLLVIYTFILNIY